MVDSKTNFFIIRCLAGGELYFHLRQERLFSEKKAKFYIEEIVIAIEHLHSIDIIYRDLKLENVLLDVKVRSSELYNVIYTHSSTRILENPLPKMGTGCPFYVTRVVSQHYHATILGTLGHLRMTKKGRISHKLSRDISNWLTLD